MKQPRMKFKNIELNKTKIQHIKIGEGVAKAVLTGKYIVLNAYIRGRGKVHINNLSSYLKKLGRRKAK